MDRICHCLVHGDTVHAEQLDRGVLRWRCRKCRVDAVSKRRRRVKLKLVEHFGGKCIRCGYNKSMRALSFHHRDPSHKEFRVGCSAAIGWKKLLKEAEKCDLLCANCHMEIEDERKSGRNKVPG